MEQPTIRHPATADRESFLQIRFKRKIKRRPPKRHRNRRPSHEGKVQLARPIVHLLRLRPVVGEMLIVEHRNRASRAPEHLDGLLHEAVAWIEFLILDVGRIVAMLSDQKHSVDRQLAASQRKRLFNRGDNREPVPLREPPPDVGIVFLFDKQRDDISGRFVILVVDPIAFEKASDEVIAVRADVVGG